MTPGAQSRAHTTLAWKNAAWKNIVIVVTIVVVAVVAFLAFRAYSANQHAVESDRFYCEMLLDDDALTPAETGPETGRSCVDLIRD